MGDPIYKAAVHGKIPEFDKKVHQLGITGDDQENEARETEAANQVTGSGPIKNPQNFSKDQIHSASIPPTKDSLESGPGA